MLPAGARLRRGEDFVATLRAGRRRSASAGRNTPALLVAHLAAPVAEAGEPAAAPVRAGFIVSRGVGGAVVRNRVRRRLRHLIAPRLASLPPGSRLVVRALPASAQASSAQLDLALRTAVGSVLASTAGAGHDVRR